VRFGACEFWENNNNVEIHVLAQQLSFYNAEVIVLSRKLLITNYRSLNRTKNK
jgi:hypothetical protein